MSTQRIQVVIEATPEQVWDAITDAAISPVYYYGFAAHFDDLTPGAGYDYRVGEAAMITGTVREVEEGRKLSMTFAGRWNDAVAALHRTAGDVVNGIMQADQETMAALREAEAARRIASQAIEAGEHTLAAYRRVISPAPSGPSLVDRHG